MKIRKRGNNKYQLSVSAGYDAQGKQITRTKTITASSDREARKQYALFVAGIEKGLFSTSGKMTLDEFYSYWKDHYAAARHTAKTKQYNDGLYKRISQALGHKRLDKIEPKHLLLFFQNLSENGISPKSGKLSPNTIRKYYILLHELF